MTRRRPNPNRAVDYGPGDAIGEALTTVVCGSMMAAYLAWDAAHALPWRRAAHHLIAHPPDGGDF